MLITQRARDFGPSCLFADGSGSLRGTDRICNRLQIPRAAPTFTFRCVSRLAAAARVQPSQFFNLPGKVCTFNNNTRKLLKAQCHMLCDESPQITVHVEDQTLEVWHADLQLWANLNVPIYNMHITTKKSNNDSRLPNQQVQHEKLPQWPSAGGMSLPAPCHLLHVSSTCRIVAQKRDVASCNLLSSSRSTCQMYELHHNRLTKLGSDQILLEPLGKLWPARDTFK